MSMNEDDDYEVQVGQNLRKMREARGMTQAELAGAVAERGLPFRQQTIVKIEKGHRPLRLREAHEIAAALELRIDDLVAEQVVFDDSALLITHTAGLANRWEALRRAVLDLEEAKLILGLTLDRTGRRGGVSDHLLNEAQTLLQVNSVDVVNSALAEHEAMGAVREAEFHAGVTSVVYRRPDERDG
jgi:transcriptional regulator with XRE-family HTH domain